eukprot:g5947.t1
MKGLRLATQKEGEEAPAPSPQKTEIELRVLAEIERDEAIDKALKLQRRTLDAEKALSIVQKECKSLKTTAEKLEEKLSLTEKKMKEIEWKEQTSSLALDEALAREKMLLLKSCNEIEVSDTVDSSCTWQNVLYGSSSGLVVGIISLSLCCLGAGDIQRLLMFGVVTWTIFGWMRGSSAVRDLLFRNEANFNFNNTKSVDDGVDEIISAFQSFR